jgi:hypothetical protein
MLRLSVVESKGPSAVLEAIKARAIARWGDDWLLEIVREYVRLANAQGDTKATVNNRKSQTQRAFEAGSCRLDTAMLLAEAVGCQFHLVCTEVQVLKF